MVLYYILVPLAWLVWHIGFRIRVEGRENLKKVQTKGYILAPTHVSAIDPVFIVVTRWGRRMVVFAKKELFEINGFLTWFFRCCGGVCVRGTKDEMAVITQTVEACKQGETLLIFPEGTREKEGKLLPPKSGLFVIAAEAGVELVDYFAREELTIRNAIPTAEGCIGILLRESTRTLWGANILLLGFGPVGRALAVRLAALGARVTVAARRPVQRAMAEELGLRAVPLTELATVAAAFDTVVNTIPAPVLTAQVLAALPKKSLIVDLASKPGGTDFAAARRLGHTALHALSLPTVWAPETAGEALARTVQAILQEREGTV